MILKWPELNSMIHHKPLLTVAACLLLSITVSGCVQHKTYVGTDKPVVEKELDPVNAAKNRIALGLTYLQKGNTQQAKFNLEKALEFAPDLAEANYSMAYYYQTVNDFDKARAYYEKVIDLDDKNGDAYNNYGVFLCQQGEVEKAKQLFLAAIEIDSYLRVAQTYENLGLCLYNTGIEDYQTQAKPYFARALGYDPKLVKSVAYLTQIAIDEHNLADAKRFLQRLDKLVQGHNASILWLSYQLAQASGQSAQAQHYAQMLIGEFPESSEVQLYLESIKK
ncbi:type IV pilus biogenesis/stability protein PilW [Catenovulum sp. 2E275]|uniref:type IV pilus biogenesis/stability protein PilW n=1 Tax=Catenovulum sp. 2E275 TaxID=2980497 RepID=UPI0021D115F6|nr:type IV pilus biogenesis/stability protein PilW [Catenovulum sp. 2E275]MCU4676990.1 type IV pilus biogenesis/stability protein PilW [Catenovulum sp. 2E275]